MESKLPKNFHCLTFHDQSTNLWINHCLDFDIVTSGMSEEDAWSGIKQALKSHVENCVGDDFMSGVSTRGNAEKWRIFIDQALASGVRSELIEFDIKEKVWASGSWLKGVQVESLTEDVQSLV
jgi:hypothetical protein